MNGARFHLKEDGSADISPAATELGLACVKRRDILGRGLRHDEVLAVAKSLGYRKVTREDAERIDAVPDAPQQLQPTFNKTRHQRRRRR